MAEDVSGDEIGSGTKDWTTLFNDLKVPDILEVKLPAFQTSSGHAQGEVTAKVLATPIRSASALVETSGPILEWIKHACTVKWTDEDTSPPRDTKRKADDTAFDFPGVRWPEHVKIIQNDATHLRIGCSYKNKDGRWTKITRSLKKDTFDSADELNAAVLTWWGL